MKVLFDTILVKVPELEEVKSAGGIVLTAKSSSNKFTTAEVAYVGDEVAKVSPGDTVMYAEFSGQPIEINNVKYEKLQEKHIIAVL